MIILDTNIASEPLKPKPDAIVLGWLDRQTPATLFAHLSQSLHTTSRATPPQGALTYESWESAQLALRLDPRIGTIRAVNVSVPILHGN